MFNVAKIKKLIKKTANISGISFPPTDDKPATDILFTIDGVVAFRISSYDTEIVAKLIEVGAIGLNYKFKKEFDLTKLMDTKDLEPFTLTPIYLEDDKKTISILQGKNDVSFVYKEQVECFKEGNYFGLDKALSPIYWVENDIIKGLIMTIRGVHLDTIQDVAVKLTPTVTIEERNSDPNFGYCSNCARAERLRTWKDYKHCPVCGYKIGGAR